MAEYCLSADELIAKAFRMIQSSRKEYRPYGKNDWIAGIKKLHRREGDISAGYLQDNYPHIYVQGVWIFGDWDKALSAGDSIQNECGCGIPGPKAGSFEEYAKFDAESYHLMPII